MVENCAALFINSRNDKKIKDQLRRSHGSRVHTLTASRSWPIRCKFDELNSTRGQTICTELPTFTAVSRVLLSPLSGSTQKDMPLNDGQRQHRKHVDEEEKLTDASKHSGMSGRACGHCFVAQCVYALTTILRRSRYPCHPSRILRQYWPNWYKRSSWMARIITLTRVQPSLNVFPGI